MSPPPLAARASWRKLAAALLALAAFVLALRALPLDRYFIAAIEAVQRAGAPGVALYWLLHAAALTVSLPNIPFVLASGFLYGPIGGAAVTFVSNALGALITFTLGRTVAREWVAAKVRANPTFTAIDEAVADEAFTLVLLLRLSPLIPYSLLGYTLSITKVPFRAYAMATLIGNVPGALLFAWLGSLVPRIAALLDGRAHEGSSATKIAYWVGLVATVIATVLGTRAASRALARRLKSTASDPPPA